MLIKYKYFSVVEGKGREGRGKRRQMGPHQPLDDQAVPEMVVLYLWVPPCTTALGFKEHEFCSKAALPRLLQ